MRPFPRRTGPAQGWWCFWSVFLLCHSAAAGVSAEATGKAKAVELAVSVNQGVESNVFLSRTNPQSDSFTHTEANVTAVLKPLPRSIFFAFLSGSYQHYPDLDHADRIFANAAIDFRYLIRPRGGIGVTSITSFGDLRLLDTEGNTLPQDQFRFMTQHARLYGLGLPHEKLRVELGGFYGLLDAAESEGADGSTTASLDFVELGGDLVVRFYPVHLRSGQIKYKGSWLTYDGLQARNRNFSFDGQSDPDNPSLSLIRHELAAKLKFPEISRLRLELSGKFRLNRDRFEDHLSYRQGEVKGEVGLSGPYSIQLLVDGHYKVRYYTHRRRDPGAGEALVERFVFGSVSVARNISTWFEVVLRYEWNRKTSSSVTQEFSRYDNHKGMVGLKVSY